jgi:preprotein translocase subunit SecB
LAQPNIRLRDFRLLEVDLKLDPEKSLDLQKGVELKFAVGVSCDYMEKKNLLKLVMEISPEGERFPCYLRVKGGAIFEFDRKLKKKEINELARVNCSAIVFPFMREAVADLTRRAGLDPVYAPIINFIGFFEQDKEKPTKPRPRKKAVKAKVAAKKKKAKPAARAPTRKAAG